LIAFASGSSCTGSEAEVGVYAVPSHGGGPDAAIVIPPIDAAGLPPDVATAPCQPGVYEGTFTCNFGFGQSCTDNPGMGGLILTGPLSLKLQASGEFLTVSGATLNASSGGYTMTGPLDGLVDCRVKKFAGSFDGDYAGPAIPLVPTSGKVAGPVNATYDPRQPALTNGTWCFTATSPGTSRTDPCADIPSGQPGSCLLGSCKATWSAVKVPGS
jgi:hypothetical protein